MYLTFGEKIDYHVQAYFSMLSFHRQTAEGDHIVMVTTAPHLYKRASAFADVLSIDDKKVEEWQGKHHFFWRAKIKAIEMVANKYSEDDLLYLDCDTFLYGDISHVKEMLKADKGLMDVNDGHPSKRKFKPQRMWKTIAGHTYDGITLGLQHDMWIAGVVGIPAKRKTAVVETALKLCDGMLDDEAEPIVIEQYALSVAMFERASLHTTEKWIGHYWANKDEWITMANNMMLRSYFMGASIEEESAWFKDLPLQTTPVYVRKRSTARRLKNLVSKLFPDKNHKYIHQA